MRIASKLSVVGVIVLLLAIGCSKDNGSDPIVPEGENHAPVIQEIPDTTGVLADTLWIPIEASDPDGDTLHFQLLVECSWSEIMNDECPRAGIRSSVMKFWFWPRSYDLGWRWFMAVVSDGRGGSDSTRFSVRILSSVTPGRDSQIAPGERAGSFEAGSPGRAIGTSDEPPCDVRVIGLESTGVPFWVEYRTP